MVDFHCVVIKVVGSSSFPRVAAGIETLTKPEIIGKRHHGHELLDRSGRIRGRPIEITAEDTDGLQGSRCRCRTHGIPVQVHCRHGRVRIPVFDIWKEPENAQPCELCVRRRRHCFTKPLPLAFVCRIEKRALLDDWTSEPSAE